MKIPRDVLKNTVLSNFCRHKYIQQLCNLFYVSTENYSKKSNCLLFGECHAPVDIEKYKSYDIQRERSTGQKGEFTMVQEMITMTIKQLLDFAIQNHYHITLLVEKNLPFNRPEDDTDYLKTTLQLGIFELMKIPRYRPFIVEWDMRYQAENEYAKIYSKEYDLISKYLGDENDENHNVAVKQYMVIRTLMMIFGIRTKLNVKSKRDLKKHMDTTRKKFDVLVKTLNQEFDNYYSDPDKKYDTLKTYKKMFSKIFEKSTPSNIFFNDVKDAYTRANKRTRDLIKKEIFQMRINGIFNTMNIIVSKIKYSRKKRTDDFNWCSSYFFGMSRSVFNEITDMIAFLKMNANNTEKTFLYFGGNDHAENIFNMFKLHMNTKVTGNYISGKIKNSNKCVTGKQFRKTCEKNNYEACRDDEFYNHSIRKCQTFDSFKGKWYNMKPLQQKIQFPDF